MGKEPLARRTEWAILVLGLAGIPAIWFEFAWATSPMEAWRLFSGGAADASDFGCMAVSLAALLSFFFGPFVSLAQLSRCLGRPCSVWERRAYSTAASVAIAGCLALLVADVAEGVIEQDWPPMGSPVAALVAFGIVLGALILWRRMSRRHEEDSAECLLMGAYIGGMATWAACFAHYLEPTAAVAGFTCVVYALSLWRRIRQADAAE